jgi:DNA-binding MarR family transcriptional regulator
MKYLNTILAALGEMINRMAVRSLIIKRDDGQDRRSAEVLLAPAGRKVLLRIVALAAQRQRATLAQPHSPRRRSPSVLAIQIPYNLS